ncbi:hypothetical protein KY326_04225 [Candidatus Woesearchaeota archaeon]|nr:hypothetical protein [Candidatus Woesearchaeota archaeon]
MSQTDDMIWAYCDGCEALMDAEEHAWNDGYCEQCAKNIRREENEESISYSY